MVRDVRGPSLAHSPSIGVLLERQSLVDDSAAGPGPSSRKMSRSKAGSSSKATPRTSTMPSDRKLANLLSSEANDTPVVTKRRLYVQSTPMMMRADETMLYDIAPPPDMPSSSLFGDESDDDTLASPRSARGNTVKGRGNLLTPVNSTLFTAPPPPARLSASRSARLPSPESLPQAGGPADLKASQSRRGTSTPRPSNTQRSRAPNAPADTHDQDAVTPSASQHKSSLPPSSSTRRQPVTPNHASRHATPPRPLVAETAYFRRTLTPIARKALKGKVVGCMEKPIHFEGEDPLLLEPELRHRSGSMTPGSVARTKRTPKTAPAGGKSRTKLNAPPATSVAQRLFVQPDKDSAPVPQSTPDEDSDDDEAGNDTFVDIKKRRQPPQRSALGSQPPLNASDLKSSDTVGEEDATPKRPSPLIDLGRFVHPVSEQETAAVTGFDDDLPQDEAWAEPLFLPGSPDSSVGSPLPLSRDPSPVDDVEKEESVSLVFSPPPRGSQLFPPSSPPRQPSPVASQRSSPALHAPTPTLGVSSPIRPPPSSPAVIASPAFPPSPALRAPTPGGPNPSPLKARESLRKSVQVRSHAGKRLSESLRSPSVDDSGPPKERATQQSRPSSSRLQSPFVGAQPEESAAPLERPAELSDHSDSHEEGKDDFNLEGDTVIAADGEDSLELEETYANGQDADAVSPPRPPLEPLEPNRVVVDTASPSRSQVLPTSSSKARKVGSQGRKSDGQAVASGSATASPSSSKRSSRKKRDSEPVPVDANGTSDHAANGEAEESTRVGSQSLVREEGSQSLVREEGSQSLVREGTAEDPLLLEPAPRSAPKSTASHSRQTWLDRVRARSNTPASPLGNKKSGEPVSSLDRFLALSPAPDTSHLAPPQPSPQPGKRHSATPDLPRPRFSLSPSMARAWRPQGHSDASSRASPPQIHPVEAIHGFEAGLEDTVALPSLDVSNAGDLSPGPDEPIDFSVDGPFSDDDDLETENVAIVVVEHQELSIQVQGDEGREASFDLSADTVREIEDGQEASFDLSADTVRNIEEEGEDELPDPKIVKNDADLEQAEQAQSDQQRDDKANSRSPYVSDDSPLADVVNAAIDAGMVIDADVQRAEAASAEQHETPPAPPSPEEPSSEAESDDEPLMPSRLRRSLHAGATPMRPKAKPVKVAPPSPPPPTASPPRVDRPVTPVRGPRSRVSEPADRTPSIVPRPSSTGGSSPFVRDYSSPFMVRPSASPVASATKSSGGRSARVRPEIVVEPSSPLVSPNSARSGFAARATQSMTQNSPVPSSQWNVRPSPGRARTSNTSHGLPSSPPSVPPASVERLVRPLPVRKSVTPTPTRSVRASATPVQEPASVERTAPTPIVAPTPRAIRPLPYRGASVTPRAAVQQDVTPSSESHLRSHASSRASSRARSRSPLPNFSPKAIGTATAIAATALAVAVPAAASPSPAAIRVQVSPEPELSPLVHSAVSHHAGHPRLDLYRSPPRSSRSSRLSATPSAHSTQSERSRSPYEHQDRSDHVSLANSRLAFALAGLSDDDDDDLPPPPVISVTPSYGRSFARTPSASFQLSPVVTPRHDGTSAAPASVEAQKTPKAAEISRDVTPTSHRETKLATPRPRAEDRADSRTPLASHQPEQPTPHLRVAPAAVTPQPIARAGTHTPQSSVEGRTPTPASSVKTTPQAKTPTLGSSVKATLQAKTPTPAPASSAKRTPQAQAKTPTPAFSAQATQLVTTSTPQSHGKAKVATPQTSGTTKSTTSSRADVRATPTPRSGTKARTGVAEGPQEASAIDFQEAEEDRDIGADDTVVHDIGADDTIDGGSAWDFTAAELTYDAEITAFDDHAFKGADWDVTRIERVPRGASEDHRLQDIEEASEEGTVLQTQRENSHPAAPAEVPAEETPARPSTAPRAPSMLKSPVRQSPRLAARRRAQTQTPSPASKPPPKSLATRSDVRSPQQASHAPIHRWVRSQSPTDESQEESVVQAEPPVEEHEDGGATAEAEAEQPVVPNRKVTLKVVTRIVKVESDSEDEEITEVVEVGKQEVQDGHPMVSIDLSPDTAEEANRQIKSAAPPPPSPPPAPPLPETVSTSSSETRVESSLSARDHPEASAVNEPSRPSTSQSEGKEVQTKSTPAPLFTSRIPLATAGRPHPQPRPEASSTAQLQPVERTPVSATPTVHSPAVTAVSRPAQKPEMPLGRTPTSFVKEQSRQIEQALGRRPAIPSKLSKQVVPSSSPAESPVAERTYSRPHSRASHEGPTSPSASRRRQSDVAETSFASSSSSSRLKRRYEDHFDDDDSERYAHRASLHEELTAASDSGSEFEPEFPSMVAVSSIDPRAAARAAAILKMHHNWVENGIMPDGSRVGTPRPQERSRARSVGALETPQTTGRRTIHETPHSRFFDSIESSRLISKEELLHEAELELVGTSKSRPGTPFAADSPMRHIPGAWAATPRGRTPKRKRDSDEHLHGEHRPTLETPFQPHARYDSSTYEGNVDGRSWTKRDWKYLEKTFKYLASKAEGPGVNFEAVVEAFLKQTGKEPAGEWSHDVLLMRVRALARRHGKTEVTEDREAKRQKTTIPTDAPPSTLRKVMGWLWRGNSKPEEAAEPAATSAAKPKKQRRDNDFLQTRDDSFEIGEVTMAATPSRPRDRQHASLPPEREELYDAERSFEVDLERGHQSYDIPYEEEEEEEEEEGFFPEPTTYTARGERSSVTEASTSMYDHTHHHHRHPSTPSTTRKIYPALPELHFPSRPHSLASSGKRYEASRPPGSRLPVMGTPRPRARVRSDSSIADTSIASRPGSVRDMVRGFEETQELDLSFESARREREKNELLGLRRVRSVVEKVKEQHQL